MCKSLVSEDDVQTSQNVEVQQEIHYKFHLFLEVRSCSYQNTSRNSTAPIRPRNSPDKNCDSHLSPYEFTRVFSEVSSATVTDAF